MRISDWSSDVCSSDLKTVTSRGNGPVDALFNAIRVIVPHDTSVLERYEVHAVTGGTDAQAEVSVLLSEDGRTVRGRGAHVETMVAPDHAYENAIKKLMVKLVQYQPTVHISV